MANNRNENLAFMFDLARSTSALTVSKCGNFETFFSMEYDSMILKTHFSHCEGSQKFIFNAFNASAILLSDRFAFCDRAAAAVRRGWEFL